MTVLARSASDSLASTALGLGSSLAFALASSGQELLDRCSDLVECSLAVLAAVRAVVVRARALLEFLVPVQAAEVQGLDVDQRTRVMVVVIIVDAAVVLIPVLGVVRLKRRRVS